VRDHPALLRRSARVFSLLALAVVLLAIGWAVVVAGEGWISDFHVVNDLTPTQPGTTETISTSTPTIEPEDFIPFGLILVLAGVGLLAVRAAWRSRPGSMLVAALVLTVFAFVTAWSIGLLVAPAALLLYLAAASLVLAGRQAS